MNDNVAHSASPPRRKAYSYLRFSTPEQSKGNSFKRQRDLAVAYAAQHNLDLDHELTFHDVGVSAYRGQNADVGRLAYFVEAVRSGQVPPGSLLLVEQLDRISRLTPLRALQVLLGITSEGVGVVTLNDGKVYTQESLEGLPLDLIISIITFTRANEESATKASRLRAAWEAKRAAMADGRPLTSVVPAWLRLSSDRQGIEVIADRAALVRRVFDLTLEGVGQHKIAETFNLEDIKPWGRGKFWHRSYIAKLLSNPAVVGVFQPHVMEFDGAKKRRRPLEALEGYFPAIISPETFRDAQVLRQAHGAPQRGKHAHAPITNILAGLAACPKCSATMTRVAKGPRSRPTYVCNRAKSGAGCEYKSVPCALIDAALLERLPERLRDLEGATGPTEELGEAIEAAQGRLGGLQDSVEMLLDELSYERSPAIRQRLREREADLKEAREALGVLLERLEKATGKTVGARVERALAALQPSEGEPVPGAINLALRSVFKRAVIDWGRRRVDLEWHHGGTLSLPYSTGFGAWPGPGWVWQQQEGNENDD